MEIPVFLTLTSEYQKTNMPKNKKRSRKILFASSEAYPLIKTGGLGDVSGSLPTALKALQQDVRLVLPAYREILEQKGKVTTIAQVSLPLGRIRVLERLLPGTRLKVWLVDCPPYFDRPGNPYQGPNGLPWPDNAERFALFCQAITCLALNQAGLDWQPDLVHCNDWQTGLVPALLTRHENRPATLFTIHNLAYQGLFPETTFSALNLPWSFWSPHALEFYGKLSFMKGGLVFADRVNTVSPTYAEEIQTPEFGCGLDGLLRHRRNKLSGILNGVDKNWNPANDPALVRNYSLHDIRGKQFNKKALQQELGLSASAEIPLLAFIGRLVAQKGIDLLVKILPEIVKLPAQVAFLGSGEKQYEQTLQQLAQRYPEQIAAHIGFDEALAHRIEAGADMFLMPSRFEPCGLNQMYSLRYGTIPIVHRVGGLADTVVDSTPATLENRTATGVVFERADSFVLLEAIKRAALLYEHQKGFWQPLQQRGMRQDFSWQRSAKCYLELYEVTLTEKNGSLAA